MPGPNGTPAGPDRVMSIGLPGEVAELLGASGQEIGRRLLELALVDLFRRGEVSSGWAAERLGIPRGDFIRLLAQHAVPYLDEPVEELSRDAAVVREAQLARNRRRPSS